MGMCQSSMWLCPDTAENHYLWLYIFYFVFFFCMIFISCAFIYFTSYINITLYYKQALTIVWNKCWNYWCNSKMLDYFFHSSTWNAILIFLPRMEKEHGLRHSLAQGKISFFIPCLLSLLTLSRISQDTVKTMKQNSWRRKKETPSLFHFFFFFYQSLSLIKLPSAPEELNNKHDLYLSRHGWLASGSCTWRGVAVQGSF